MRGNVLIERHLIRAVAPAPEAVAVARLVHGDPVNPGAEARLAAESVDGAEDPQEDFLRQVERLVAIAQQVHRQLNDHPLVLFHKLRARGLLVCRAALHERRLAPADVRPGDRAGLFHGEFHYTNLDPASARKFRSAGRIEAL